ncbi:hypothetical protein MIR68_003271 [Amoeboaphelidium protococcarum]|nr:hypothetical protein MIR68_003271 [Amoeboaphelidium protococcarum]
MAPRIRTIHDLYRKDDANVRNTVRDGVSDDEASSPKSDAEIKSFMNRLSLSLRDRNVQLKIILWFILLVATSHYGFGGVYLCMSILVIIYMNTSTNPQDSSQMSAYSVFNRNNERILGDRDPNSIDSQLKSGTIF